MTQSQDDARTRFARQFIEAIPHSRALGMELEQLGDGVAVMRSQIDGPLTDGLGRAGRVLEGQDRSTFQHVI